MIPGEIQDQGLPEEELGQLPAEQPQPFPEQDLPPQEDVGAFPPAEVMPEELPLTLLFNVANLAEKLDSKELEKIGRDACEGYRQDLGSRSDWEKRYEDALKLAAQVVEEKTFPWPNASNVKYPLLTTACVQFSARAYPALIPGVDVVKCRVTGFDETGQKEKRATRVGKHMSYQILEEMEEWEEDMDRLLIMLPITGTEFKKTYYSPSLGRNVSEHILAKDLVVDYWAKSVETAERVTHRLFYRPNQIRERVLRGLFLECKFEQASPNADVLKTVSDTIHGVSPPPADKDTPHLFIEQHCFLDLDKDGYSEPYIVTVHLETEKVVRISARYDEDGIELSDDGKIISITPVEYFTKYSFIPSLDGGFYDLGWGILLSPLNEAINTTINQLVDAGTLSNTSAGFLSKGIKVRSGQTGFKLGEWKTVDSTGDDLRKGIVQLPARDPSQTLFQLLGLMISSGEKLSNLVDILMGENPGQNQPATTTMAVIEQGLKVFTAVYKRLYRSLKKEYRKLYRLNKIFLDEKEYFTILDPGGGISGEILRADYGGDPTDIQPSSDPNIVSEAQRLARAEALVTSLQNGAPVDPLEVWRRYYEAMNVPSIETLLMKELPPPQPDPKVVKIQEESKLKEIELNLEEIRISLEQETLALEKSKEEFSQWLSRARLELDAAIAGEKAGMYQLESEYSKFSEADMPSDVSGFVAPPITQDTGVEE